MAVMILAGHSLLHVDPAKLPAAKDVSFVDPLCEESMILLSFNGSS
jgi:hypothetical protein